MRLAFLLFVLCVLLLVAGAARSDSEPDTVTLTREQIGRLEAEFEQIVLRREAAAFEAGKQSQKAACRSLI